MATTLTAPAAPAAPAAEAGRGTRRGTGRLLTAGALAAPLFAGSVVAQAATRDGYDITRHPASVLANGSLGFVQVATFLACCNVVVERSCSDGCLVPRKTRRSCGRVAARSPTASIRVTGSNQL